MLELADVDTFYGERHVLYGISLKVPDGSVVAMLGRNGMGKTTIIRTIMGLTPARSGNIRINNEEIGNLEPFQIARKGLGLVPQGRGIFPSLSVKENLTIAARRSTRSGAWDLERIYDLFPILKQRSGLYANLLSGGEQQMLTIARALMINPDVLIMDEPSEGLAPLVVKEISRVIGQLKGTHSVLLAEQNINMALGVADYVYLISKGTVVYESKPQELKNNQGIKTKYLGV
jgi:branched-chain amino acid transport system ATP-binding protein